MDRIQRKKKIKSVKKLRIAFYILSLLFMTGFILLLVYLPKESKTSATILLGFWVTLVVVLFSTMSVARYKLDSIQSAKRKLMQERTMLHYHRGLEYVKNGDFWKACDEYALVDGTIKFVLLGMIIQLGLNSDDISSVSLCEEVMDDINSTLR